jgi:DNA-binding NarL/FixJ family response regulator
MPRLLLVGDHVVVREGIRTVLERAGLEIVAEADDRESAVRLVPICAPDVVVLDLAVAEEMVECARKLLAGRANLGIVLLASDADEPHVAAALHAGVRGYVVKTQGAADLVQAIREVNGGGVYLAAKASGVVAKSYIAGASSLDALSPRLRQVLRLIAEGRSTREIGQIIGVTEKSAELYRSRIMNTLDIHDTAGLVRYALRTGLADL